MIYRRVKKEDLPKIEDLCIKSGVKYDGRAPFVGFVAEGDSGELVGFIFAHQAVIIEPFISESDTAAVKLYYMMEGALSAVGTENIIAHTRNSNEKLASELKKVGFVPVDRQYTVSKRSL